ncbi:hypothetical protein [Shimia biformata]|uniref:hypothetical protein n=1 Tax=Shimia biformata TaxID=1294299 RepID=UPI00194E5E11|nr:hypothetical protein [Shimia biformata]
MLNILRRMRAARPGRGQKPGRKTGTPPAPLPAGAPKTGKLILHVGDHKTGSTSIQYALAAGRVTPEGKTLYYPAQLAHNYLRKSFDAAGRGEAAAPLAQLARQISGLHADFTVISGEDLEGVSPDKARAVWDRHFSQCAQSMQVIAYVRPHAARVLSSCVEQIKIGLFHDHRIEDFLDRVQQNGRFIYAPRFGRWHSAFGADFTLRPMIRAELHQGSVVEDFLQATLDGTPYRLDQVTAANESLPLRDLMIVRLIQDRVRDIPREHRLALGWAVARHLGTAPGASDEKLRIHKGLARRMAEVYMTDARDMDGTFFDGRPLLQTELEKTVDQAPETAQSLRPEDHFSADEIRDLVALANLISEMMHNKRQPWPKHFRETRIKALTRG